jgi:hypothetical protein
MARIRKDNNPAKARSQEKGPGEDGEAANGGPHPVQGVIEFPKPPRLDDVVSERIIFEIGDTRISIKWTAEIEQLPPGGPVAVERKQQQNSDRSS